MRTTGDLRLPEADPVTAEPAAGAGTAAGVHDRAGRRVDALPAGQDARTAPPPAGVPRPVPLRLRRFGTVRAQVLVTVLLLTALGMAGAGSLTWALQAERIEERVRAGLAQEVDEFERFLQRSASVTGDADGAVDRVCREVLAREVPRENEVFACLVEGRLLGQVDDQPIDLALEDDALDRLRQEGADGTGQVETSRGVLRYATVSFDPAGTGRPGLYLTGRLVDLERRDLVQVVGSYAAASALALVVVGVAGALVAGRLLAPVREVQRTAMRISDTDLSRRIQVRGDDDVSRLARTFNEMLERLETSFETQRRFLDDAGHELRTPLTIVRGHLDLQDPTDPADVAQTQALVLEECQRMARLVDELVLLARSERPDFVVRSPVDLQDLMGGVHHKAQALGERRWRLADVDPGVVEVDPQRLTQAVLQLAANAVRHTAPDGTITMGAARSRGPAGEQVRVWVADDGEGIAPQDRARVFERFQRGPNGGSGLGLAIVDAIAQAHGGRVELDSRRGRGSTFSLVLPAAPGG